MPYKDAEARKRAKRESARKQRAKAVDPAPSRPQNVDPRVSPCVDPSPITASEIMRGRTASGSVDVGQAGFGTVYDPLIARAEELVRSGMVRRENQSMLIRDGGGVGERGAGTQ